MAKHEYLFDVKLFAAVRVTAENAEEARAMIRDQLECADTNFGTWDNGDPICAEASLDGELDLVEVDGETPAICAYCGEPIEPGEEVRARRDDEYVHDGCRDEYDQPTTEEDNRLCRAQIL